MSFVCGLCLKSFATPRGLNIHIERNTQQDCAGYRARVRTEQTQNLQAAAAGEAVVDGLDNADITQGSSLEALQPELLSANMSNELEWDTGTSLGDMEMDLDTEEHSPAHFISNTLTTNLQDSRDSDNGEDEDESELVMTRETLLGDEESDDESDNGDSLPTVPTQSRPDAFNEGEQEEGPGGSGLRSTLLDGPIASIRTEFPVDAGVVYNIGTDLRTLWEVQRDERDKLRPQQPYHPWRSEAEFKMVEFLTKSSLSQGQIDEFLELEFVSCFVACQAFGNSLLTPLGRSRTRSRLYHLSRRRK